MKPEPKASNLSPIYMTNTLSNRALLPVNFIKVTLPLPNSRSYCPVRWLTYLQLTGRAQLPINIMPPSLNTGWRHCTQLTAVLLHCGHYVTNRALAISKVARVSFFHFDVSSSQLSHSLHLLNHFYAASIHCMMPCSLG